MWKNVKDFIPPMNKPLLVCFDDGDMEVAIFKGDNGWWSNDGLDFNYGFDEPLFWQELPDIPDHEK